MKNFLGTDTSPVKSLSSFYLMMSGKIVWCLTLEHEIYHYHHKKKAIVPVSPVWVDLPGSMFLEPQVPVIAF